MASLAKTAVSPYPAGDILLSEWPTVGKGDRSRYTRTCKVTLTGQGSATNSIPAAAFGFTKLLSCGPLIDIAGSKVVPAGVDPTRNIILLSDATLAPADVTSANAYITVEGIVSGYSP